MTRSLSPCRRAKLIRRTARLSNLGAIFSSKSKINPALCRFPVIDKIDFQSQNCWNKNRWNSNRSFLQNWTTGGRVQSCHKREWYKRVGKRCAIVSQSWAVAPTPRSSATLSAGRREASTRHKGRKRWDNVQTECRFYADPGARFRIPNTSSSSSIDPFRVA